MKRGSLEVKSPLGANELLLRRMFAVERLGQPFEIKLELLSENHDIVLKDVLGKPMTVVVEVPDDAKRHFSGLVSRFAHMGTAHQYASYKATLRPWLWFMRHAGDSRIFQEMSVPDMAKAVFRKHGFTDFEESLSESYRKWEFRVQYRESDLNFVSRLLEQEGIYYYFKHEDGKHTLVLSDSASAHQGFPGYSEIPYYPPEEYISEDRERIGHWVVTQQVRTGTVILDDFDFEAPKSDLESRSAKAGIYDHGKMEVYEYPGEFIKASDGEFYARVRRQAAQADQEVVNGEGDARGIATGYTFKLGEHKRKDQNRKHLVVSTEIEVISDEYRVGTSAEGEVQSYGCTFQAMSSETPYRPPRTSRQSRVEGPQTAVVVGPEGEEIYTDKYGRVKVHFHWDHNAKDPDDAEIKDENRSCWIRVAQIWAGKEWGWITIPRVGQEVMVDFLEGDPDRPIVTGRVYNKDHMPPYKLPEAMTKSTLKTRSTKEGNKDTFNELRFEDKKEEEEIYFHAEKDFNRVVENNDTLKVGFDKADKGDRTVEIHNNHTVVIGNDKSDDGSEKVTIWKDRTVTIEKGNEKLQVKEGKREVLIDKGDEILKVAEGHRTVDIDKGNETFTVGKGDAKVTITAGKYDLKAGKSIELKVGGNTVTIDTKGIVLKVGGNSVKIDNTGVVVKGTMVKVQGTAMVKVKAPMTDVKGDAMLKLKGGLVMIN